MTGSTNGDRPGRAREPDRPAPRPKSPVDQWFELFVYAPLGFALDARQLFPRFVDRGRSQVVLARVIGKYAVKHGSAAAGDRFGHGQAQVAAVLQTLGWLPEEHESADPSDVEDFEADTVVFHDDGRVTAPDPPPAPSVPTAPAPPLPTPPFPTSAVAAPDIVPEVVAAADRLEPVAVDDLAIPDYDNLSASQVVPRLAGLSSDELELVRRYEAGKRGRKTILNKVAQLQSA
jgi:hypothetical protein